MEEMRAGKGGDGVMEAGGVVVKASPGGWRFPKMGVPPVIIHL